MSAIDEAEDDAREIIAEWKQEIVDGADANAIPLGISQSTEPGDVWKSCDGLLASRVEDAKDRFSEPVPLRESPLSGIQRTTTIRRTELQEGSLGLDLGLGESGVKLLDAVLAVGFSQSDVEAMEVTLGLEDPMLVELENPQPDLERFYSAIGEARTPGNVFVVGVLQGRVRLGYTLIDDSGRRFEIAGGLSSEINGLPGVEGQYVEESSSGGGASSLVESGEHPTAFAAIVRDIASEHQDAGAATCPASTDDTVFEPSPEEPQTIVLPVLDGAETIFELTIEEGGDESANSREWFLSVEHVGADPLDMFTPHKIQIRVRNRYGHLIDDFECSPLCTPDTGGIEQSTYRFEHTDRLLELSFELMYS